MTTGGIAMLISIAIIGALVFWGWWEIKHADLCRTCDGMGTVTTFDGQLRYCPSCAEEWHFDPKGNRL